MASTQERILAYLRAHPVAAVAEISAALGMTPHNIRHHLTGLLAQERVVAAGERPPAGRGRPAQLYRLSERDRIHNLDGLAGAALDALQALHPDAAREAALRDLARRLAGPRPKAARHLTQRLTAAVQRLNELHYQAHWEAHADAPHVLLGHCPYAAILDEHPMLCRLDALLLEGMLGQPARQTARQSPGGPPACVFRLAQR